MNILLVEDNKIKRIAIEHSMHRLRPECRIRTFNNLEEAEYFLDRNAELTDLMILDWCFPESLEGNVKTGAGKEMLDYVQEHHYNVRTIICSGNEMNDEELKPYKFLLGHVLFGKGNPGDQIYRIYLDYWARVSHKLRKLEEKQDAPKVKKLVNNDVK